MTTTAPILAIDGAGHQSLHLQRLVRCACRSLTAEGGQNPLEPAMLGCAVLSGPNVQNFRDAYQQLARGGGARVVRDVEMLAKAVHYLLSNDVARRQMVDANHGAIQDMRGALSATIRALEPYLNPLTVSARLQPRSVAGE